MKFIPDGLARIAAKQALVVKKNSPSLLFGAGVAGSLVSTVLACRATLKLEDALEETNSLLGKAHLARETKPEFYSEKDEKQDIAVIYIRGAVEVGKLYAPAMLVGAASIACLTKSQHILKERNLALASAYTAVDEAFKAYRARVVEKYGVEEDRVLRYESEDVVVIDDKTGKEVVCLKANLDGGSSMYAKYFDETSTSWQRESEYNYAFLTHQQNWFNDILRVRRFVFLNEVYKALGLMQTTAGQAVGWFMDGEGDSYIDFGLYRSDETANDFINGRENSILLDFNVDGPIYHLLDQMSKKENK